MNVRSTFEANAKTTETMEPRMSAFDDPTEFAQAAAVFGAAPGDDRFDAALAKSASMRVGVVATVGVDEPGLAKRSAASAANRWDSVDERQQLRDIVAVRAGHDHADRNTVRVYEDVVFGVILALRRNGEYQPSMQSGWSSVDRRTFQARVHPRCTLPLWHRQSSSDTQDSQEVSCVSKRSTTQAVDIPTCGYARWCFACRCNRSKW